MCVVRVELHPEAHAELRAVAVWYDERRPGLGDEFVAEMSSTLARIGEVPGAFPSWPATSPASLHIRRAVLADDAAAPNERSMTQAARRGEQG